MSIRAMTWAWTIDYPGMFLSERYLLLAFADYADDNDECWPSTQALVEKTHMKVRTIEDARRRLKAADLIRVRRRGDRSSLYWLNLRWQLKATASATAGAGKHPQQMREGAESAVGRSTVGVDQDPRLPWEGATVAVGGIHHRIHHSESTTEPPGSSARELNLETPRRAAQPATPPPAAAAPAGVVGEIPAPVEGQGSGAARSGEMRQPPLPGPEELIAVWNATVKGSPLVTIDRSLTKAERGMLMTAIKHPAFGANIQAFRVFARWASNEPFYRGENRPGAYPASFRQVMQVETVDRWAHTAKPQPRPKAIRCIWHDPKTGAMLQTPIEVECDAEEMERELAEIRAFKDSISERGGLQRALEALWEGDDSGEDLQAAETPLETPSGGGSG